MRRRAGPWDRFYRFQAAPWRGERDVSDLIPLLGRGPVLELGCGNGKTLRPLRRAGVDAIGLDVSWHAVRRLGHPCMMGDAARLPFRDATFTGVLDLHCTGHLPSGERAGALREARRVSGPGGVMVQERLGPGDLRAGNGTVVAGEQGLRVLRDGRATAFLPADALAAEAEAAGWRVERSSVGAIHPRIRGDTVRRETLRLVLRR